MPRAANLYYHASDLRPPEHQAAPPLVLVHGAGGSYLHWPPQVRRLPGLWTMAVDLPGHGRSAGVGEQTIEDYARRLLAWAEAVGIPSAIWVGHSMGGAIVQTLALQSPEKVAALGLIATGARLPVNPKLLESTAHQATYSLAVETIMRWAFSPQTPARVKTLAARRMMEVRHTVVYNDFVACNRFDVSSALGQITCPTLVLHGTADRMTPLRFGEFLAREIPHAQLITVPEAGHMVMLERPQLVAEILRRFAQEVGAAAA